MQYLRNFDIASSTYISNSKTYNSNLFMKVLSMHEINVLKPNQHLRISLAFDVLKVSFLLKFTFVKVFWIKWTPSDEDKSLIISIFSIDTLVAIVKHIYFGIFV